MLRDTIAHGAARGDYRLASAAAGELCNLLQSSGRLEEALKVAEEKAGYTRQAGLGPWTQLVDEGRRLQVLAAMGRYDEVLAAVEALRLKMDALPLESEADGSGHPWNVREALLDTGCMAALRSERWETALALNAEVVKAKQAHGAEALAVARTAASTITVPCSVCAATTTPAPCSMTAGPSSRPSVTSRCWARSTAPWPTWKTRPAAGPRPCASRRSPWATSTRPASPNPAPSATTTWPTTCGARAPTRPPSWPTAWRRPPSGCRPGLVYFVSRCTTWRIPTSPPPRLPSPTWSSAWRPSRACASGRCSRACPAPPPTATPPSPPSGRWWRTRRDAGTKPSRGKTRCWPRPPRPSGRRLSWRADEFRAALHAALAELPEAEAAALVQRLREAGLILSSAGPDMTQVLHEFEPLLQDIAAAVNDEGLRAQIEPVLADLEAERLAADRGRPPHLGRRAGRRGTHRRAGYAGHRTGAPRSGTSGTVRKETRSWTGIPT